MEITQKTIDFVKGFEGLRLESYEDPAGRLSIGFGTTRGVVHGLKITEQQAEGFLSEDLFVAINCIKRHVSVDLNDNQVTALVDFIYNLGCGNFYSSALLKKINAKEPGASKHFLEWDLANGTVLGGLRRRRQAEKDLYDQDSNHSSTVNLGS